MPQFPLKDKVISNAWAKLNSLNTYMKKLEQNVHFFYVFFLVGQKILL